jgi:hypothetical protein
MKFYKMHRLKLSIGNPFRSTETSPSSQPWAMS